MNNALAKQSINLDLSPETIKKARLTHANKHWTIKLLLLLSFCVLFYAIFFSGFTISNLILLATTVFLASFSWFYHLFINKQKFERRYLRKVQTQMLRASNRKKYYLKRDFDKHDLERGARQLERFEKKFQSFTDTLNAKFKRSQLTHSRYLAVGQEVYFAGVDNLHEAASSLKTLNSIDIEFIEKRLEELENLGLEGEIHLKEQDALITSKKTYHDHKEKIDALLAQNETALSKLDETTISISKITKTKDRNSKISMDGAINELHLLAQRTKYYSKQ